MIRGVGEGGGRGGSCPPTFVSMPPDPPRRGRAMHAPFLTRPPSSQLAPTPLMMANPIKDKITQTRLSTCPLHSVL